jgi:hypothetical protein
VTEPLPLVHLPEPHRVVSEAIAYDRQGRPLYTAVRVEPVVPKDVEEWLCR